MKYAYDTDKRHSELVSVRRLIWFFPMEICSIGLGQSSSKNVFRHRVRITKPPSMAVLR